MAEDVIIQGADFSGGMPLWATETTQLAVLDELGKLISTQSDAYKELSKTIDKTIASGGKGNIDKDLDKALGKFNGELTKGQKAMKGVSKAAKKTAQALGTLSKALAGGVLTGLGILAAGMTRAYTSTLDLTQAGADLYSQIDGVASGMQTLGWSLTEANISLDQMTALQKAYGTTLNKYGIQQFAKTTKAVSEQFKEFGFTAEEAANVTAEYLDQQRLLGISGRLSAEAERQAMMESIKNTVRFSKAMGKSREEIEKQSKTLFEDVEVESMLRSIVDPKQAQAVRKNLEHLSKGLGSIDSGVANQLAQAIANPFLEQTNVYKELNSVMPQASMALRNLRTTARDQTATSADMDARMAELSDTMTDQSLARLLENKETLAIANAVLKYRESIDEQRKREAELADLKEKEDKKILTDSEKKRLDELNAQKKTAEATASMQDALKSITGMFDRIVLDFFGNAEVVKGMSASLTSLGDVVSDNAEDLTKAFGEILKTAIPALKSFFKWFMKDGVESIKSFFGTITKFFEDPKIKELDGLGSVMGYLFIDPILDWLRDVPAKLAGAALVGYGMLKTGVVGAFKGFMKQGFSMFKNLGPMLKKGIGIFIRRIPIIGGLIEGGADFIDSIMSGHGIGDALVSGVIGFGEGILKTIIGLPAMLIDLIAGTDITSQVNDMVDMIGDWFRGLFTDVFGHTEAKVKGVTDEETKKLRDARIAELQDETEGFNAFNAKAEEEELAKLIKQRDEYNAKVLKDKEKSAKASQTDEQKKQAEVDAALAKEKALGVAREKAKEKKRLEAIEKAKEEEASVAKEKAKTKAKTKVEDIISPARQKDNKTAEQKLNEKGTSLTTPQVGSVSSVKISTPMATSVEDKLELGTGENASDQAQAELNNAINASKDELEALKFIATINKEQLKALKTLTKTVAKDSFSG